MVPRLSLQQITCRFGETQALSDVSLDIEPGTVACLLGPSGCGKSTTLRIAAGVERQSSGQVLVEGRVVSDAQIHAPPETRGIGLMFQDFALFPHLSVRDNVGFGLSHLPARLRQVQVEQFLQRVGLPGFGEKYPHMLSGGEQQRVALARALAPRPKVMLMDEPFSSLDMRLRDRVRDEALAILKEEGTSVLLVTHEPEEAMRMADRVFLMRAGRIIQSGSPYNVYNYPIDRQAAEFFSDVNVIPARVMQRQVETAFGPFLAPPMPDGARVELVIRPQHLIVEIDDGINRPQQNPKNSVSVRGQLIRARFMGTHSVLDVRVGDLSLKAATPGAFLPEAGQSLWVALRRAHCLVFPA